MESPRGVIAEVFCEERVNSRAGQVRFDEDSTSGSRPVMGLRLKG
jgi:dTDP-4-dehydrorhamnose 3,5-epimerase-like enzyme